MVFYRNLLESALDVAPSQTMQAITKVVRDFQMPGHGIEDYGRRSVQIAMAGIYDLRIHHDEVVAPILRKWNVWDRDDLDAEGEQAREELASVLAELDSQAKRFEEKRAAYLAKQAARAERAAVSV
jgi:acyl-[acyl-carrier-protein] desaturase